MTTTVELEHTIMIVEGHGYGERNGPFFYSKPNLLFSFFSQSRSHYLYNKVQVILNQCSLFAHLILQHFIGLY
jgi:hypothetical protein